MEVAAAQSPVGRDSWNYFGRLWVPYLEGWILDIQAACNYPTKNANFKSWFCFLFLTFVVAPSGFKQLGAIRTEKKWLLGNYPTRN